MIGATFRQSSMVATLLHQVKSSDGSVFSRLGCGFYSAKRTLQMRVYMRTVKVTNEQKVKRDYVKISV